jgi:hypothetical protein
LAFVPAPDDRWRWMWKSEWNANWQGKPQFWEKAYFSATLSATNPTWPDQRSNPGRRRLTASGKTRPNVSKKLIHILLNISLYVQIYLFSSIDFAHRKTSHFVACSLFPSIMQQY